MRCVNLKNKYGTVYKIDREPGHSSRNQDPWLWQIRCRRGHIAPWGGNKLVACTDTRGPTANKLMALPGVQVAADGQDGVNVVFDAADLAAVVALMLPCRRKRLSPEQRAAAAEGLARHKANVASAAASVDSLEGAGACSDTPEPSGGGI